MGLQAEQKVVLRLKAYNRAGGFTLLSSDGFTIDATAPNSGYVVDGADIQVRQHSPLSIT